MTAPPEDPVRVLIVDDHAPFRRLVRELLERRGLRVVAEASGARDALDAAARSAPEAALLDIRLGGGDGDGFALCRALMRAHPRLAVVLVSSDDRLGVRERVEESGARGFVAKSRLAAVDLRGLLAREL
jgi:DNA-binding NarL/FixJ family response regulator